MDVTPTPSVCAGKKTNLRIVLLGKSGVGKSAAGNTILGTKAFESHPSFCSVTSVCEKKKDNFRDLNLDVIDTPSLFGTKKTNEEVIKEITKGIGLAAPGPHVFLIVIQLTRFTPEDEKTVEIIKTMFGEEAARYTMILFTHGDVLKKGNITIEDMLENHQTLKRFISRCSSLEKFEDKYHVFDNEVEDSVEVSRLLQKINRMVQNNGGSYYTKEMAQRAKQEEMERPLRAAVAGAKEKDLRIVLVGKTGVGKSASGNTILGKKAFQSKICFSSVTSVCEKETTYLAGLNLTVIDTPGLIDACISEQEVVNEIARCISMAAPGPHVFLIVLQLNRFTEEERKTMEIIQKMFGEEVAKYTMVLFSHGDDLEEANVKIGEILESSQPLKCFVSQCAILQKFEDKYYVFNNRSEDPAQVRGLLLKILTMVQHNGGSFYTNEIFREAERAKRKGSVRSVKEEGCIIV